MTNRLGVPIACTRAYAECWDELRPHVRQSPTHKTVLHCIRITALHCQLLRALGGLPARRCAWETWSSAGRRWKRRAQGMQALGLGCFWVGTLVGSRSRAPVMWTLGPPCQQTERPNLPERAA